MWDREFEIPEPPAASSTAWMLTFADLLSLILAFFVLLFASTSVKAPAWESVAESLAQRLNPDKNTQKTDPAAEIAIEKEERLIAQDLGYLYNILQAKISASPGKDQLLLQQGPDAVFLQIVSPQGFAVGSSQPSSEMQALLVVVSEMLRTLPNRIEVVANPDEAPQTGEAYAANWQLAFARALEVAVALRKNGYLYRLAAYGRGDNTEKEIPERLTAEQKPLFLKRIDIIIRPDRAEMHPKI